MRLMFLLLGLKTPPYTMFIQFSVQSPTPDHPQKTDTGIGQGRYIFKIFFCKIRLLSKKQKTVHHQQNLAALPKCTENKSPPNLSSGGVQKTNIPRTRVAGKNKINS